MPTPPPSTPEQIQLDTSIEQQQLNNFLGPVNGALGGLPVAEKNQEYFIVFQQAGGTGPEIIDETAYFITYLVDSKGNVSKPSEDYDSLYNTIQNFEIGRNAIVRNDASTILNTNLTGKKKITAIGRQESILYSQTGSSAGAYVDQLSFDSDLTQEDTPRMEGWLNKGDFVAANNNWFTVTSYNSPPFSSPDGTAANFVPVSGEYQVVSSGINNTQFIFLQANTSIKIAANAGVQSRNVYLRLKRDSTVIGTKTYTIPGNNTSQEVEYNFESDPLTVGQLSGFFDSGDPAYTVEMKFEDAIYLTSSFVNFRIINQSPTPSSPIVTPNYWENNSGGNIWLTGSEELSINYGNTQNSQHILDVIEPGFNFSPIENPFVIQPGDKIRFEYNKETEYIIYEIIEPGGAEDGKLKLRLNTLVPSSVELNNFVIHRVNINDPAYIILDVKKDASVGDTQNFNGVILPEYPTQELKDNLDSIILNLKERGIITDNEN